MNNFPSRFGLQVWCAMALLSFAGWGCSKSTVPGQAESKPAEEGLTEAEATLLDEGNVTATRSVKLPFFVYQDAGVGAFVPDGWMGDSNDVSVDLHHEVEPRSGKNCVKIEYRPGASQNSRWAGVYWQFPGNHWGNRKGGYDLTGAKKLSFWARGDLGGEVIQEVKIGGITGAYRDSDSAGIGPISLTKDWKRFEIDLDGVDVSYISGGFCWSTNLDLNKNGCTFYLDDIAYE